jgi:hypothetical protein
MKVMRLKKINDLFYIKYGNSLDLASLTQCKKENKNAINFVSRTSQNNGVSAVVEKIADVNPLPAGTLSVAVGGSVMETFLQPEEYYTGYHVLILTPKKEMTDKQKLFYCVCIRANKYKYNYGRQANKTLKDIIIPDITEIPDFINKAEMPNYSNLNEPLNNKVIQLDTSKWKPFTYNKIFNIKRGESVYLQDMPKGEYPYVSATSENNGISGYVSIFNDFGNCIVLNYDGSIGEAFYHEKPFFASEKVVTITLKNHELNKYIAFFIIALLRKEKYRYNYGLKWSVNSRMLSSIIKLPIKDDETPDFDFMESYIKSLPYSKSI